MKLQGTKLNKRIRTWMTYTSPHFKYGALYYNQDILKEKSNVTKTQEINNLFKQTFK